jgi:hypothetical protein
VFLVSCNSIIVDKTNGTNIFPFFLSIFFFRWKEQKKLPAKGRTSAIASIDPFSWLVMLVVSGVLRHGYIFFANVQNSTHPLLSSLPNTVPKATGEALQLAVI